MASQDDTGVMRAIFEVVFQRNSTFLTRHRADGANTFDLVFFRVWQIRLHAERRSFL